MSAERVEELALRVSAAFETQLGLRGTDLARQTRQAGRRLPKAVRTDLKTLIDARSLVKNPKLAHMVNLARLEVAARRVVAHLKTIDRKSECIDTVLGIAAGFGFGLITLVVVALAVMRWRGLI